jgi:hypothetical protein
MKMLSAIRRFVVCGMGLVVAGVFLMARYSNAAEQKVRFNIPACMS